MQRIVMLAAMPAVVLLNPAFVPAARAQHYGGGFIEFLMTGAQQANAHARQGTTFAPAPGQGYGLQPQGYRAPPGYGPPPGSSVYLEPQAQPAPVYGAPPDPAYGRRFDPRGHGQPYREAAVAPPSANPMRTIDPKYLRHDVDYHGEEAPGTIIVNTRERFLYLVQPGGRAIRWGIGVGRPGFTWAGAHKVTSKREWPDWVPPPEMLQRQPYLPRRMAGGPDNPLGARALYLGSTLYRIHGSNEPWTIGQAVSSGCIRMRNEDVVELYSLVDVGAKVIVI